MYADDSLFFYNNLYLNQNIANIKHDISLINEYFEINKLTLNIQKSKHLYKHFPRIKILTVLILHLIEPNFIVAKLY